MKKRIIHEQQIVDFTTGEIMAVKTSSLRGNEETFTFNRTTEGHEWLRDLNAIELKLLMIMVDNKNRRGNTISLTVGHINDIADTLRLSTITIKHAVRSLRSKGLVKELSRGTYLVSPLTIYSGGSSNWKSMYQEYNGVKDLKY